MRQRKPRLADPGFTVHRESDGITVATDDDDYLVLRDMEGYWLTGECEAVVAKFQTGKIPIYRVSDVWVDPSKRRMGIGIQLYRRAFEAVKPAIIVSGDCTGMGTTKAAAEVWRRLSRSYKVRRAGGHSWVARVG